MSDDASVGQSAGQQSAGTTGSAQQVQGTSGAAVNPKILADFGLTSKQILDAETKYSVPQTVKEKYPDLVALLLKTESMNVEEREYWFQVMPVMSDEQIVKLHDILTNERSQLKKIDNEYAQQISKLGQSHRREWNSFEASEKKKARLELEKQHEENELQHEELLLKKLQDDGKL